MTQSQVPEGKAISAMNLFEKIQAIGLEVMNIEKDMTVGTGRNQYKAISDNAVTLAVKRAEKKFRVHSMPVKQELLSHEITEKRKDNYVTLNYVDNIKMVVRFVNLDNTSETIDVTTLAKGVDPGDKGLGKASTYARKYALLNAYKIVTGEDPDADKSEEQKADFKDTKRDQVIDYCMKNGEKRESVLAHFNLGSLDDMSDKQIAIVWNQFKAKKYI